MGLGEAVSQANEQLPSFFQEFLKKTGKELTASFNSSIEGLDLTKYVGQKFKGDFALPPDVLHGIDSLGRELISLANQNQIDLRKTREFSGADFDKDGKLSPQEVGSLALAASLNVESRGVAPGNDLRFDNELSRKDIVSKLLTPEAKEATLMLARQMLKDSGVAITAAGDSATQAAVDTKMKPDTVMRC